MINEDEVAALVRAMGNLSDRQLREVYMTDDVFNAIVEAMEQLEPEED